MPFRIESDSMGEVKIPEEAYYGPQTRRAEENFPVSGRMLPRELIHALALIKAHAAAVNRNLGLLDDAIADAVIRAATEVREARLDDNLIESISLLAAVSRIFAEKCIDGITANADVCNAGIQKSLALATLLVHRIGYDRAAVLAKAAHDSGKTVRETAIEAGLLPEAELNRLLNDQELD
ncbi:MAG: hypothetical protein JRI76_11815 [Deltaproteobacteria bacterium]|nr:hypothetical protein [Deltaproteobacteria bacterium]MBW2042698.1 hypothetical protein [Deltaproteobacteria bacterium]MBW2133016.1 hypothetical protein [Deltaproteobacteria bacterium]